MKFFRKSIDYYYEDELQVITMTFCEKMFVGCKDMHCSYVHSLEEAEKGVGIAEAMKGVWFTRPQGSLTTLTNSWKMCQRFLDQEEEQLREIEQTRDFPKQLQKKLRVEQLREQFMEYFSKDQLPSRGSLSKPFIVSFTDSDDDSDEESEPMTVRLSDVVAEDDAWLNQHYHQGQSIRNQAKKEYQRCVFQTEWSSRLYAYHQQWNGELDMDLDNQAFYTEEDDMDLE